ncbi:MAG: beta-propeller domain-containing protein [Actinomycetota bacterium]|nr:beta-propeller domain-containing protein [Actinomycetota bacterium]
MRRTRRLLAAAAAVGVLAGGCAGSGDGDAEGDGTGDDETVTPADIQLVANLTPFDACDDLLSYLRTEGAERVGPYGFGNNGGWPVPMEGDMAVEDTADAEATDGGARGDTPTPQAPGESAGDDADAGGPDFSDTNVQEEGVDEPDSVKTDGERIVTVNGNELRVIDVTGDAPVVVGTADLGEDRWGGELFLRGDRAFVMGRTEVAYGPRDAAREIAPNWWGEASTITEVDLSDPADPEVVASLTVDGGYLSARAVDGTARIVVRYQPRSFPFVFPSNPGSEETAEAANQQAIAESTLEQWLPGYELSVGDDTSDGLLSECDRVHRPAEFSGFDSLTVLTVDLDEGLTPGDGVSVLANGSEVYASSENLYVATPEYVETNDDGTVDIAPDDVGTDIHQFAIPADGPADYLASGRVGGSLLNQFSMSEHEGVLRVATTEGFAWSSDETSESYVRVLQRDGERLEVIGEVGGLGEDERIYSVRFIGDRGYVVTFRQVDPLYVIDLSDPTAPATTGELKILGYSSYLHPIGDHLLIGVGQDATEEGRTTGTQVSLFDVSNPTNPQRLQKYTLDEARSNAEYDHHAFLWWAPEDLAVLPVSVWQWDEEAGTEESFHGAVGLDVTTGAITERGRLAHPAENKCEGPEGPIPVEPDGGPATQPVEVPPDGDVERWCWVDQPQIERTLVIGDVVYSLSRDGIGAHPIATLGEGTFVPYEG